METIPTVPTLRECVADPARFEQVPPAMLQWLGEATVSAPWQWLTFVRRDLSLEERRAARVARIEDLIAAVAARELIPPAEAERIVDREFSIVATVNIENWAAELLDDPDLAEAAAAALPEPFRREALDDLEVTRRPWRAVVVDLDAATCALTGEPFTGIGVRFEPTWDGSAGIRDEVWGAPFTVTVDALLEVVDQANRCYDDGSD